jgi:type IV pilus assembly protein PilC
MSIPIEQFQITTPPKEKKTKNTSFSDLLNRDFSFGKKFNDKKKERLYTELSMLLKAGVDIKTTLEIAFEEQDKKQDRALLEKIKNEVIGGKSLSDAVASAGHFSEYEFYSLKIGEESGKLADVMENLAGYFSRKIEQKRKLISTFSYPTMVLTMAILAIYFMLNFIVPMFEEVFKRFDGELPALTRLIISMSEWFSAYALLIFLSMLSLSVVLYSQRKQTWYRKLSSTVTLRLPFIGDLTNKIYMARFCHSMHFLIGAKNPLLRSLQLVRKMIGFYPYEEALKTIEDDILHGISLSESMSKFHFFNRKTTYLIKVAEEVNQLELILEQLNKQFTDEVTYRMNTLGSLLEPLLILFIGFFVAVILVAMYLPLFQLSTSVF